MRLEGGQRTQNAYGMHTTNDSRQHSAHTARLDTLEASANNGWNMYRSVMICEGFVSFKCFCKMIQIPKLPLTVGLWILSDKHWIYRLDVCEKKKKFNQAGTAEKLDTDRGYNPHRVNSMVY